MYICITNLQMCPYINTSITLRCRINRSALKTKSNIELKGRVDKMLRGRVDDQVGALVAHKEVQMQYSSKQVSALVSFFFKYLLLLI